MGLKVMIESWGCLWINSICPQEAVRGEGCHPLEVVFVSKDDSPSDMLEYMKDAHGDWLAVQHGAKLIR